MKHKKEVKKGYICENCKNKLTKKDISFAWQFGKIWFCGNACATAWAIKEIQKLKSKLKK